MAPLHLNHHWIYFGTDIHLLRTAEVEAATGGDVDRTRNLAGGDDLLGLSFSSSSETTGMEERSMRVYGWYGLRKNSAASATSQILPRYIMATREATLRIRLRSWVINRYER